MSRTPFHFVRYSRLTLLGLILCIWPLAAHADEARQYKIEAAYLYNFVNYITWPGYVSPQELKQPTICLDANDPVKPYLGYVQRKVAKERTLTIRMLDNDDSPEGCHVLFTRHHITKKIPSGGVLTVFQSNDPLDRGGMIELTQEGEVITMIIDNSELADKGFQVSSRLLSLAQKVK